MSLLLTTSGDIASGVVAPEGVDFDGSFDYLSRSTDLVGNVDSKTFTFSCWVYVTKDILTDNYIYGASIGGVNRFTISATSNPSGGGILNINAYNLTGTRIFQTSGSTTGYIARNQWNHIAISIDLSNIANRYVYVNEINFSSQVAWSIYTNDFIDFSVPIHTIGDVRQGVAPIKGRLSNIFLDYTYRDLSIEANRRLFITADGKPTPMATLKALNPILYLPMKDAATAHINDGTGGNFTPNGTFATSNRGANQPNCTQLSLDGTADYLSRSGLAGTSSKELLISVNTKAKESATLSIISTRPITLQHIPASSKFSLKAYNSSNVLILSVDIPIYSTSINIEYSLQCSVDLTNTSNRKVQLNGIDITASCTWITYTNNSIDYSYIGTISIGLATDKQEIGELYLGNSYLSNLSSFWETD